MIVMLGEIFSNQNSRLITAKYLLKYLQHNKKLHSQLVQNSQQLNPDILTRVTIIVTGYLISSRSVMRHSSLFTLVLAVKNIISWNC